VVDGGGTDLPCVTSGSDAIGGADVLTDGGGGGTGKGDDGGGTALAEGGGGTERDCAEGGGGTERDGEEGTEPPALRPGGGGTLRPGGGAEVPGFAAGGALEK